MLFFLKFSCSCTFFALFFAVSCDSGVKFNNPNDINSDAYQGDSDQNTPADDSEPADDTDVSDSDTSEMPIQHRNSLTTAIPSRTIPTPQIPPMIQIPHLTTVTRLRMMIPILLIQNLMTTRIQAIQLYESEDEYRFKCDTDYIWTGVDCMKNTPQINYSYDIGTARPYEDKIINGKDFYDTGEYRVNDADTATWEWTLEKGPCDIVLNKTSFTTKGAKTEAELEGEGTESNVVSGVGLSQFKVKFKSSGSYKLHLKITRANGEVYECEWILNVVSDGLRVELCWDKTGTVDLDLYLGKNGVTTAWKNNYSCYYANCKGDPSDTSNYNWKSDLESWGYEATMNYNQSGVWTANMKNPRLYENIKTPGLAENLYLDNPNEGDTFRVLVNYFSSSSSFLSSNVAHPVVNVYCGGIRKATFGGSPSDDGNSFIYDTNDFNSKDDSWKAVEIKWVGDYASDSCELTQICPNGDYVINQGAIPETISNFL